MLPALLSILLLGVALPSIAAAPGPQGFARCEQLAALQPETEETASCFQRTGAALQRTPEAAARLRELLQSHPGSPWLTFHLALLDSGHAAELSRAALAGFLSRHDARGEVAARNNLYRLLYNEGRLEEAGAQIQPALAAAERSGQPEVIARAHILQ